MESSCTEKSQGAGAVDGWAENNKTTGYSKICKTFQVKLSKSIPCVSRLWLNAMS